MSPVTSRTPESPRPLSQEKNSRQDSADSVYPSEQPMTSRSPAELTPMATSTATFS